MTLLKQFRKLSHHQLNGEGSFFPFFCCLRSCTFHPPFFASLTLFGKMQLLNKMKAVIVSENNIMEYYILYCSSAWQNAVEKTDLRMTKIGLHLFFCYKCIRKGRALQSKLFKTFISGTFRNYWNYEHFFFYRK